MDMESRERMKARNVHGRRLNVSGKDVIKASQSLGKGDLIEDYIKVLENKHMSPNPPKWLV